MLSPVPVPSWRAYFPDATVERPVNTPLGVYLYENFGLSAVSEINIADDALGHPVRTTAPAVLSFVKPSVTLDEFTSCWPAR
jgi:hypothetical protein